MLKNIKNFKAKNLHIGDFTFSVGDVYIDMHDGDRYVITKIYVDDNKKCYISYLESEDVYYDFPHISLDTGICVGVLQKI